MPLVSIIVPIYNKENELAACIQDIKQQSYSNLDIILVNDGSTDNSGKIAEQLKETDERIRVIHKENEGVSIARNIGIQAAKGDFIAFVDPDDRINQQLIERLLSAAVKTQCQIVSCCAEIILNQEAHKNSFFKVDQSTVEKRRAIAQLLSDDYYNDTGKYMDIGVVWGKLYRKDLLDKYQLNFKPSLRRNQDNIFNLYAFHYANQIYYIDEPLYKYNYDNIQTVFKAAYSDADVLYCELAQETEAFVTRYYKNNQLLMDLCHKKVYALLLTMIRRKLLNPVYQVDYSQRMNLLEETLQTRPFNQLFAKREIKFVDFRQKILFRLLKKGQYKLIYKLVKSWWYVHYKY